MKRFFFIFIYVLLLASCDNHVDTTLGEQKKRPVIAEVGNKQFHETDIDFEIMSMPESMRYVMQDPLARAQVLDVMIKREVVAQKARGMGLILDPLIAYRVHQAENMVLIESIRDWQKDDVKKPTGAEEKVYYDEHLDDFIVPEQIHARHILVSDKQTALEILKQLKATPENFSALAAQFSIDDSTKGRSGDLNWFARGMMVKAFEDAAFALSEKHPLSEPVKTDFGWHLIEWLGERQQSTPTFEDVRDEIEGILEKQRLDAWIKKLMQDASIEVFKAEYHLQQ